MGLEIKNRQKQTADLCKQHLRQKYPDKLGVGGRVYRRFEGPPKNSDLTRWGEFTDIKDIKKEMFRRLENQSSINGWTPLASELCQQIQFDKSGISYIRLDTSGEGAGKSYTVEEVRTLYAACHAAYDCVINRRTRYPNLPSLKSF
jgi:hypothetical protein